MRISDWSSDVCSSDLATGIGDNVGIISFEIEREQDGAVELPAGRGNSRAVAYLDRLGNRDTATRLAARYLWQPVGLLLLVASFAQGDRCENLTGEKRHRSDRLAKLFRHHRRVEQGHAEPAMLFGDEHSGNAQIVEEIGRAHV